MELNPYLLFDGNCEKAFKFYEQHLGGKIETITKHGGSPMEKHVPAEWRHKVMHARMTIAGNVLMGSDPPPDRYQPPQGISVSINVKDAAEADRIFEALSKNGRVSMPIQKTFWATRFAMLTDRFGIPWMINCE